MLQVKQCIGRLFLRHSTALKIIGIYAAILCAIAVFFYPLIPILLNYPQGTVGGTFQRELENADYTHQFIMITLAAILFVSVCVLYLMRGVEAWPVYMEQNTAEAIQRLKIIRRKCMTLPYSIYMVQTILPSLLLLAIHAYTTSSFSITTLKIWTAFFSFLTLAAVISHMFARRILTKVLVAIAPAVPQAHSSRIPLDKRIFIQMIPMFMVALMFTSLIGYSRLMKEKGALIFTIYAQRLQTALQSAGEIQNQAGLRQVLASVSMEGPEDLRFLVSPQGAVLGLETQTVELSPFFLKYMTEMSPDQGGKVYDYYGFDIQGAIQAVQVAGEPWIIGVRYVVTSEDTLRYFLIAFIVLLSLICLVLSYFSRSLAEDISVVARGLKEIAEGQAIDLEKQLPVTSNDEIGDLVAAFNKIQEKEKANICAIKANQEMLMEQERLASLGQLIGGIAHNLKTPIMSIAGGLEALEDLIAEYDESIEDAQVTGSDHHEIASEMRIWISKLRPYCSYMSEVISAVKGQAVQYDRAYRGSFTVGDLIKRVDILMTHELMKYNCKINVDSHVDMSSEIEGEISSLVQVIDNIVVNAIQAYGEASGVIDFCIEGREDQVVFSFQDYGAGIPWEVQPKLFKEMLTTKGKDGTGLGLYMSYSIIKGGFGGNMWFESIPGKGATFYISVPCNSRQGRYQEVMA